MNDGENIFKITTIQSTYHVIAKNMREAIGVIEEYLSNQKSIHYTRGESPIVSVQHVGFRREKSVFVWGYSDVTP